METNGRIAVLSHHLAGTGNLDVLSQLLDMGYDSTVRNKMKENILHAFIRLNNIKRLNSQPLPSYYEEALGLLAEHSQKIINEKDILGFTAVAVAGAVDVNDQTAFRVLENKNANLGTKDIFERDIADLALARSNYDLFSYLKNKVSREEAREVKTRGGALHGKRELMFFNFEPFIQSFVSYIALTNPQLSQEGLEKIYFVMLQHATVIENLRLELLSKVFYSGEIRNKRVDAIFSAISSRDTQFFQNITEEQKEHLSVVFSKSNDQGKIFVTHFLLEAIRYSFLPAIKVILPHYKGFDFVRRGVPFNSFDPLSLSLFTYASLDTSHPFKSEAQEIVKWITEHIGIEDNYVGFVKLPPIGLAILLGLLEEVQFLHENRGVEIPSVIRSKGHLWEIDTLRYTLSKGFINLHRYLQDKFQPPNCQKIFLN